MSLKKLPMSRTGFLAIIVIVVIVIVFALVFFAQKKPSESSAQLSTQLLSRLKQAKNRSEKLTLMTQTINNYPNFFSKKRDRGLFPFTFSYNTSKAEGELASEAECREYLRLMMIGNIIWEGKDNNEDFVEAELWMLEQATTAYENFLKNGCTRYL